MRRLPVFPVLGVDLITHERGLLYNPQNGVCALRASKNLYPKDAGVLTKRGCAKWVCEGPAFNVTPTNFQFAYDGLMDFVVTALNEGTGTNNAYAFQLGGNATGVQIPNVPGFRPAIIPHQKEVYVLPGQDYTVTTFEKEFIVARENPSVPGTFQFADVTWVAQGGDQTIRRSPRVGGLYNGRMVWGNFGDGYETTLTFADPLNVENGGPMRVYTEFLSANGGSFRLPGSAGDRIVAICEIGSSGVDRPLDRACLVLCEFSAYVITGEMLLTQQAADPERGYLGTLNVARVNESAGCGSAQSLVQTPYGPIWAGPDDVWMFPHGRTPIRIGTKIRPALEDTPADRRFLWHAAYHDGFYRLAICSPGQNPSVVGKMEHQYWLDLRNGPPRDWSEAMWWGPMEYKIAQAENVAPSAGTYAMAYDARPGKTNKLYAFHRGTRELSASMFTAIVELDADGAHDSALNTAGQGGYTAIPVTHEDGNAVLIEMKLPEMDAGDPDVEKLWLGGSTNISNDEPVTLRATIELDDGRDSDSQDVGVDQKGLIADVDDDHDPSLEPTYDWQSIHLPRDPDKILRGTSFQLTLTELDGYTVVADGVNSQLVVERNGIPTLVALTPGRYATKKEFLDMVVNVLETAVYGSDTDQVSHSLTSDANGVVTFEALDVLVFITQGITQGSAEPHRRTRKVLKSLGFDVSSDVDFGQAAGSRVRDTLASGISIRSIYLRIEPSGRMPS